MTSTSQAVATRDSGPTAIIEQYREDIAQVLPSHVNVGTYVRLAVGAVRRDPKLVEAARNDPGALMAAVLEAARKGLEPGTEQYYLTPRREKGTLKIKGIEGYQGIIERIYRAGAAQSVIVEVVREGDRFEYTPGQHDRPVHHIDWFGGDRGALIGVYAYALMAGGATSKVVMLNKAQVMEAKAKSDGASSQYSPWQTNEEAMWLKTAARRLSKWVPTSNEYLVHRARAAAGVASVEAGATPPLHVAVDTTTGELHDEDPANDEYIDAFPVEGESA